jgi:hypothetical protein
MGKRVLRGLALLHEHLLAVSEGQMECSSVGDFPRIRGRPHGIHGCGRGFLPRFC